jgi:hypothetical protein
MFTNTISDNVASPPLQLRRAQESSPRRSEPRSLRY